MSDSRTYPHAILHIDGDSFFASIEQSLDISLRGKVVVTGGERGAATSVSYEGKRMGLSRGMSLRDMKRICPDMVVVTSDYAAYSIYAHRMYNIVREFTPIVEEYSIDECFADITGLDTKFHTSYEALADRIQRRLHTDLGITFGVGLAPNKTLAKLASKRNKPAGLTCLPLEEIAQVLPEIHIGALWGIGVATSVRLEKAGVHTASAFAAKDDGWLKDHALAKPYRDMWLELNGHYVRSLDGVGSSTMGSIMKSRTFTPSLDRAHLLSQLSKNVEGVCQKARWHGVRGRAARMYLKTQEFQYHAYSFEVPSAEDDPRVFLHKIHEYFDIVYHPGILYRATGFSLHGIIAVQAETPDLFGEQHRAAERRPVLRALDRMNHRYGAGTIFLAESLTAMTASRARDAERAARSRPRVSTGAERKKYLALPYLGVVH